MGDLWVLTASPRTAEWARAACNVVGANGTWSRLKPVVLLIAAKQADALLDEDHPTLAFFAAWAMQCRHGPAAEKVVERAMEISDRLPKCLRAQQETAILSVLDRRLVNTLTEKIMDASHNLESRWVRELRIKLEGIAEARGKAESKQDAVLAVLRARGLAVTAAQRAEIVACSDLTTLDRWLVRAVTAGSVAALLAPRKTRPAARRVAGAG